MSLSKTLVPLTILFLACAPTDEGAPVQEAPAEPVAEASAASQDPIALAMSAAPAGIASSATIMQFNAAGELEELRAGTNGWLCLPDENPAGPGDYPICLDAAWQAWFAAFQAGEPPQITGIGMSYMLQGGPAASNTDPSAMEPPEGADWLWDGPHIMVIAPDPAMFDAFPTEHGAGGPYVMWAGTPYAHLMVPTTVE
jgi:hypothetical protein